MKYHFKIHEENQGFWAECIELEGCVVQGDTIEELCDNMYEALNLYIEEPVDSKHLAPLPDTSLKTSKQVVEVPVDPQVAFAFLVRYCRIKNNLTQQEVSKRMGFDKVYSYQRLESKRCNPSLSTISKVKEVFPDFSLDFALSS
jgi:predicted RNase H-like HicB family nuclease/DNA-binding XRE family transcriptional regulator